MPGLLAPLDLPELPTPDDAPRFPGVMSIATDPAEARIRRIPSFYLGRLQVWGDRDLGAVATRLKRAAHAAANLPVMPSYLIQPIRFEGVAGLYLRDGYNRSSFRRELTKLGVEFADEFLLGFVPPMFRSTTWGDLEARFAIVSARPEPDQPERVTQGSFVFGAAAMRMGQFDAAELTALRGALQDTTALASAKASTLVEELRSLSA